MGPGPEWGKPQAASMNVPPSPPSAVVNVISQHRSMPPRGVAPGRTGYVIPPMSMVSSRGPGRDHVRDVSANVDFFKGTLGAFRGVSIGVLRRCPGGDAHNRLATIVRGSAVIMCDYADVRRCSVGDPVRPKRSANFFRGFDTVRTASIEPCSADDPLGSASSPTGPPTATKSNFATVVLD